MRLRLALLALAAMGLAVFATAGTCDIDPWSWHAPGPSVPPYDYSSETSPVPTGFASWEEFAAYAETIPDGDGSVAGGVAGLGNGVTGGPAGLAALDTDGDGLVTVTPMEVTQPDGSGARVIGEVPNGATVTFNDDGTVTIALVEEEPAAAGEVAGSGSLACQYGVDSGINTAPDPDRFLLIAFTSCSGGGPEPPDEMGIVAFWDYVEWRFSGARWRTGGVYDIEGCLDCTQVWSQTNNNVEMPAFYGLTCRRGVSVHRVWPSLTSGDPTYAWTTSTKQCV